jgi:GAF domain-containing protein
MPRIALDVGADATYFDNPDLHETRSEVALPLKVGDNVIGVLDVQSVQPAAFENADVEVLQILADQITVAIENARLLERSETALNELRSVYGEQMRLGWRRQLGDSPLIYKFDSIRVTPVDVDHIHQPQTHSSSQPQILNAEDAYILNVPISLRGTTLGEVSLKRDLTNDPWTRDELNLVEDTMTQIAIALDNARLLDETRRSAEHEQTVSEISSRISRSIDIDSILRTAVRELGQLPNVTDASIRIGASEES